MFKTISAALVAISMLAAPAFASNGKAVTTNKPAAAKASVLNANARMSKHHHKYAWHYHHRQHKVGMIRTHSKIGFKHTAPVSTRRG